MQNLSAADFYTDCKYNGDTKTQLWCSIIADAHDSNCGCDHPFAHLLASIFPPGHTDRDLTINQIITRDYTEKCLSGGGDAEGHGLADGEGKEQEDIKQEDLLGEDIEGLLAAAAAAEDADTR